MNYHRLKKIIIIILMAIFFVGSHIDVANAAKNDDSVEDFKDEWNDSLDEYNGNKEKEEEEKESTVEPKSVKQGGIVLDSQRFPKGHYESVTDTSGDWNPFTLESIDKGLSAITNFVFGLTKTAANLIDVSLANLYSVNIVDGLADKIADISSTLWEVLKDNFGALLLVIAVIQIFAYYVGQRNSSKAGGSALKLMLVIVLGFIWFSNSGFFLKALNSVSNEVQGIVMTAGTFIADEEIEPGNELEGSQAILRNKSFDLIVYKPYLNMNYGTTNENEILKGNKNRINDLLSNKKNEAGLKEREEIAKDEVEKLENMSMSTSNAAGKLGIAITSLMSALLIGIPLIIISLVNIILQIMALIIAVVLPISFIVSFLPSFSNSGLHTLGKLLTVFLMKVFVGILLLFTFLLVEIVQTIIPADNVGLYMLNVLLTGVLLILMLVKRDKIIEFITAGRVSTVDGGISQASKQTTDKIKQGAGYTARKGAEITGKTARKGAAVTGKTALRSGAMVASGVGATARGAHKIGTGARNKLENRNEQNKDSNIDGNKNNDLLNKRDNRERTNQPTPSNVIGMEDYKRQRQETGNVNQDQNQSKNTGNEKGHRKQGIQTPNMQNKARTIKRNNQPQIADRTSRTPQGNEINKEQKASGNQKDINASQQVNRTNRTPQSTNATNNREQKVTSNQRNTVSPQKEIRRNQEINNPNGTPITQFEAQKQVKEIKRQRPRKKAEVVKRAKSIKRARKGTRIKQNSNGKKETNRDKQNSSRKGER